MILLCQLLVILFHLNFFAVHEIRSILHRNHISVASSFFSSCLEIVQALQSYTRIGSIYYIAPQDSSCVDGYVIIC